MLGTTHAYDDRLDRRIKGRYHDAKPGDYPGWLTLPQDFSTSRFRVGFQRAAQHNGWIADWNWLLDHPDRRNYVRPAARGEPRAGNDCGSSPNTLVHIRRQAPQVFAQIVTTEPLEFVAAWRRDWGEDAARDAFDHTARSDRVQWRWLLRFDLDGFPEVIAMERSR